MTIRSTRHVVDGGETLVIQGDDPEWRRFYDKEYWAALTLLKKVLGTVHYALRVKNPQVWITRAQRGLDVYMNRVGQKINVRDYGGAASKYMGMAADYLQERPGTWARRGAWKLSLKAAMENLSGQIALHEAGGGGVPLDQEMIR